MATRTPVIGIIGGSGVYEIDGLEGARWQRVASPFGEPSSELLRGTLGGVELVFLPRHGRGHPIPPSEIDYRANVDALKRTGVTDVVSLSACGSLREDLPPGSFVLVDQFVDRTFARVKSFFTTGLVGWPLTYPVPEAATVIAVWLPISTVPRHCVGLTDIGGPGGPGTPHCQSTPVSVQPFGHAPSKFS